MRRWIGPALLLAGFLIVATLVLAGLTARADLHLLLAVRRQHVPHAPGMPRAHLHPVGHRLIRAAMSVTNLGGAAARAPLAIGAALILFLRRRRRQAGALLAAWAGGGLLVDALKALAARPRPPSFLHLVRVTDLSFPSGHAGGAMILYPLMGLLLGRLMGARAGAAAAAAGVMLAVVIGATRVVLGVHWPSDVLAGWLLGGAIAWWTARALGFGDASLG